MSRRVERAVLLLLSLACFLLLHRVHTLNEQLYVASERVAQRINSCASCSHTQRPPRSPSPVAPPSTPALPDAKAEATATATPPPPQHLIFATNASMFVSPAPVGALDVRLVVITPTFTRDTQYAELTRVASQLRSLARAPNGRMADVDALWHERHVLWLLVEDANSLSTHVREFASSTALNVLALSARSPPAKHSGPVPHRGVLQRNRALDEIVRCSSWLRSRRRTELERGSTQHSPSVDAVCAVEFADRARVMFLDDDNTASWELFYAVVGAREPVALASVGLFGDPPERTELARCAFLSLGSAAEPPSRVSTITSFRSVWNGGRKYPIDMLSVSFSVAALATSQARLNGQVRKGYLETAFFASLIGATRSGKAREEGGQNFAETDCERAARRTFDDEPLVRQRRRSVDADSASRARWPMHASGVEVLLDRGRRVRAWHTKTVTGLCSLRNDAFEPNWRVSAATLTAVRKLSKDLPFEL